MTWLPEWRVTVGDDVYTTVTSVSYATGRLDIDRQATAGYCQVQIVNADNSPFTINITEPITLELKNSAGVYKQLFAGTVSDFNIGVRSPEELGYVTTGTILGIGPLSKLSKAVYNTAIASARDGEQIAVILDAALAGTWDEVNVTVTWATYDATVTWNEAENSLGQIDQGEFDMIQINASASAKSQSLVDQIANSALGIISEGNDGLVYYADADHRENYLLFNGYTDLDAAYATPSSIQSQTQTARLRNSLIYKYSTGYATILTLTDSASIAAYGLFEKSTESNILSTGDMQQIAERELFLRNTPRGSLGAIKFRLDNPDLPSAMLDDLLTIFCNEPVSIDNLPSNLLGGTFEGFVENIAVNATPTYVDMTLYVSATDFSIPPI
jgi:hypothetical protein